VFYCGARGQNFVERDGSTGSAGFHIQNRINKLLALFCDALIILTIMDIMLEVISGRNSRNLQTSFKIVQARGSRNIDQFLFYRTTSLWGT
jgi:hypothetical protein